jgi:hypothetical protein
VAVPSSVGVVSDVTLSELLAPESLDARRSGWDGGGGATVSTVTTSAADAGLTLPAASSATALRLFTPSSSVNI